MRKRPLFPFAILVLFLACFVLAVIVRKDPTHHHPTFHAGSAWWVIMGIWIGLLTGAILQFFTFRPKAALPAGPWRAKPIVAQGYITVALLDRSGEGVCLTRLDPTAENFDDQLHRAMADAKNKTTALNVASSE